MHADFVTGLRDGALTRDDIDALQFGDVATGVGRRLAAGGEQQDGGVAIRRSLRRAMAAVR
ncbi:MAG: hypothetical protein U1F19_00330 [Lysobacterales bacterium]